MNSKIKIISAILVIFITFAGLFYIGQSGFRILSGLRAYVGGEGLWAKAQREASYQLIQYVFTGDANKYQSFVDNLKIPLGDKAARLELEKPDPNDEMVTQGFREGGNHPEDIPTMIFLYKYFKNLHYIKKAIEQWETGDRLIEELLEIGKQTNRKIANNSLNKEQIVRTLASIDALQKRLNEAENQFSYNMSAASRWAANLLFVIMLLFTLFGGILCFIMLRLITGMISDLKHKKTQLENQAEQERSLREELRESEQRYRRLTENAKDLIWRTDINGKILFVNNTVETLLGYSKKDAINLHLNEYMTKESGKLLINVINRSLSDKSHIDHFRAEIEYISKNNRIVPFEINASILFDENGEVIGYEGISRDITERKIAQEEKENLERQLQRAQQMEAIGALAGGVAHDLNNILSGIVSYPDLLLMDLPGDSPLRKPILTMRQSGKKAAVIVQDLLTLARRGVSITEVVNLNDIIFEYLQSPEHEKLKFHHTEIQVETDLESRLLNILGSPVHLSKTVMNLVSNAVEAMPGGGKVYIFTKNRYVDRLIKGYDEIKEGDYAVLKISDTGIGINSVDIEKIFEPFYTKKVMGRSGTGLGMAVVWGTVKDHKGYITVDSETRKGTTITLYFPVTRQEIRDTFSIPIESLMGNGETILLVDDVAEQREIASSMLAKLGYSVATAPSGEEAIEYMKVNSADLLILDMIMTPGIDGLNTYKEVLKIHPAQKAIIASGFSETSSVKTAQRLGAGQYIKKPYSLEKIGIAVKEALLK